MKKLLGALLTVGALAGAGASQAAAISVDMTPGGAIDASRVVALGDSFAVDILVDDAIDLAGFQFDLGFDGAILSATAISSGGVFDLDTFPGASVIGANSIHFSEGSLSIFGVDITSPTLLATISFDTIAAGASPLTLDNIILSDSIGGNIPVTHSDGNATVTGGPSAAPSPGSLGLLVAGLALLRCRAKTRQNCPA